MSRGPFIFEFSIAPCRTKESFSPAQRREMRKITESLSKHIESNRIENLVLVDRSARRAALALAHYWRKHPLAQKPKIFFLNPLGGLTKEFMQQHPHLAEGIIEQAENHGLYAMTGMLEADTVQPGVPETDAQAKRKFKKMLPGLQHRADRKTLVFDTCLHTGASLIATKHLLELNGFKKLSFAVAARHVEDSSYHPEIIGLTEKGPDTVCHPFGADSLVQKVLSSPISKKVGLHDMNGARRIRKSLVQRLEIPRIVE